MTIALVFALGMLTGLIAYPASTIRWRYGPVEWTRVGVIGMLKLGRVTLITMSGRWRVAPRKERVGA